MQAGNKVKNLQDLHENKQKCLYFVWNKGNYHKRILYLLTQKIVKLLIHRNYYLILKIKHIYKELENVLHYLIPTIQGKTKKSYKNNNIEISASIWNDNFELPDGSYSVSDIEDYFEYTLKNL